MSRSREESEFATLVDRHRAELQLHCYRMLGSLEDSEDLVQETLLRAWRSRGSFNSEGPSSLRAWLYRIATNACLDALRRKPRRMLVAPVAAADPDAPVSPPAELPWLQPYPDRLLPQPDELVIARETIELAFLAAIQHLPPRQRAVLILRDVLAWSAKETASLLEASVASVNSALQRARATLREHLPERRTDWAPASGPTDEELRLVRSWVEAHERADVAGLAELLREDARLTMPPHPTWYEGREAIVVASAKGFDPEFGKLRAIVAAANLEPTAAYYLRAPGDSEYRALAMDVLRVEDGLVAEVRSFVSPDLFPTFGLAMSFPADSRST